MADLRKFGKTKKTRKRTANIFGQVRPKKNQRAKFIPKIQVDSKGE